MPKYLVTMHDGRKFQVEATAPPSEADVLSAMGGSTPKAAAEPAAPAKSKSFLETAADQPPGLFEQAMRASGPINALGSLLARPAIRHPVQAGAMAAGAVAAPFTGGMSLLPAMATEGAAAAGGTLLGHGAKAAMTRQLPSGDEVAHDLMVQGALGAAGPVAGRALGAAGRFVQAPGKAAMTVLDTVGHLPIPVVSPVARTAAGAVRLAGKLGGLVAPAEEAAVPAAAQVAQAAPAAAAPAARVIPDELPASWRALAEIPAKPTRIVRAGPTPTPEGLSAHEQAALDAELSARGLTPKISAQDAARYMKEHGQLIPPGTKASRQASHIDEAYNEQRYRQRIADERGQIDPSLLTLMGGGTGGALLLAALQKLMGSSPAPGASR